MTTEFVTLKTFNKSMKNIDGRLDKIDKRFIDLEAMIRHEAKMVADNSNERFDVFMEHIDGRFKILMEHPVFTNYKV